MSLVFFFKQKTAYEMRISDWSSDVCSSDLHHVDVAQVCDTHHGFRGELRVVEGDQALARDLHRRGGDADVAEVEVEEIAVFADPADAEDAIADAELLQELAGRLSGGGLVVVLQHAAGKNDLKLALAVEDGGNRQVVGHHGQAAVIQQDRKSTRLNYSH